MSQKEHIDQYCRRYKIMGMATKIEEMVNKAENDHLSYLSFLVALFEQESLHRELQARERLLKTAQLPTRSNLDEYEQRPDNGFSKQKINTLREMAWLDQLYNIMIMGPSGVGKTMLAAGLCADAIEKGYKAYFRTMEEIINMLKMKDFARSAMADYKRLIKASLIVIDDVMLFPVEKSQAVNLFNFINQLYENTSFIITTNKMPADWAKMLDDEVLATALLDRLLFRCEVISLSGKSYRMENRRTIFGT
ncbi:IS21-like element helper ATPase IstB [Arcticibacter eurypsychrophilus]|uniref:IS21-like element helper ATPase IstB n=1 Tax=Arcticibacter eurypsychrophilus TaxID=1434752 RepID=UPI00084CE923|nr:IS21-like element helper ATPase IstB [Arcticibacter eurypsychrophilus]